MGIDSCTTRGSPFQNKGRVRSDETLRSPATQEHVGQDVCRCMNIERLRVSNESDGQMV